MKQYTKQITVQAVQWTGENLEEVQAFLGDENMYIWTKESKSAKSRAHGLRIPLNCWVVIDSEVGVPWAESDEDFQRDYKEVTE